jgi:DNA-binding transcriptional ArsR family regulator
MALRSFVSKTEYFPDFAASPVSPLRDTTVTEQSRALRDQPSDVVHADLSRAFGAEMPRAWQPAADEPDRWVDSLASLSVDTWSILQPVWDRAEPLVEREITRAGIARVRGGMDCFLNSLHHRLHFADGILTLGSGCADLAEIGDRKLALVPLVNGSRAIISFDTPDVAYVGYPVPGLEAGLDRGGLSGAQAGTNPLSSLIGPMRADMLRSLRVPATMGQVANRLNCLPRTASYHGAALERAGLLVRERRGQVVLASLTTAGEELLELFQA